MATVTREQRAIEAWAKAMATAENYAVDPHQHIARLVEAGEQMAALLAPKDAAAQAPPASDPPATPQEDARKLAEAVRAVADRLESCGIMGRDLHLRTCAGEEDTPCNCGADDPAETLRGIADAMTWPPTAASAAPPDLPVETTKVQ